MATRRCRHNQRSTLNHDRGGASLDISYYHDKQFGIKFQGLPLFAARDICNELFRYIDPCVFGTLYVFFFAQMQAPSASFQQTSASWGTPLFGRTQATTEVRTTARGVLQEGYLRTMASPKCAVKTARQVPLKSCNHCLERIWRHPPTRQR